MFVFFKYQKIVFRVIIKVPTHIMLDFHARYWY
jgi:hypothetical protein